MSLEDQLHAHADRKFDGDVRRIFMTFEAGLNDLLGEGVFSENPFVAELKGRMEHAIASARLEHRERFVNRFVEGILEPRVLERNGFLDATNICSTQKEVIPTSREKEVQRQSFYERCLNRVVFGAWAKGDAK